MEEKERYLVVEGSESGHCCFEYSIVDTSAGKSKGYWKQVMCETFEKREADIICKALNQKQD